MNAPHDLNVPLPTFGFCGEDLKNGGDLTREAFSTKSGGAFPLHACSSDLSVG